MSGVYQGNAGTLSVVACSPIISAGTQSAVSGTVVFANSNNITFGMSDSTVTASFAGGGGAGNTGSISAGTTRGTLGEVVLSNSNGVTFGINGQTVTASHNGLTSQSNQAFSAAGGSSAFQTLNFNNANGATFSNNAGSVELSYTVPSTAGLISAVNFSAGTTSNNSASIWLRDSNGVSFGLNAGTITATVKTDYLTSQSNQAFSADASSTFQTLTLQDSNGISFSNNAGAIRITHALQFTSNTSAITSNALHSSASRVINIVAATNNTGGGTASLSSNVSFSAANGATFYTSAGNAVVLSYSVPNVPAQTNQTLGLYASSNTTGQSSSTTVDARTLSIRGMGVASVGYSAGELVISVPSGGGAGDGGNIIAAGTQTANTTGTVVFSNSNGLSFGMSNSSVITASYTVPSTAGLISAVNFSAGTTSNNSASIWFRDSNGLAFGLNAGTITGSYTVPTVTNSSMSISDAATSGTIARLAFTNLNGVTLSLSTGAGGSHTIVGSHNALTSQSNQAFSAAGGSSAFQTLGFSDNAYASFTNTNGSVAITEMRGSFFAASNTTQSSSGTQNLDAITFAGAGIASVGVTNGSILISVPSGGGAGDGVNIIAAGTQTANTTGTVVFSNSNGISFGMSNSSVITAQMPRMTYFEPYQWLTGQNLNAGSVLLQPIYVPDRITATRAEFLISISNAASQGMSVAMSFGLFTYAGSTASSASSSSAGYSYNSTLGGASSATNYAGARFYSMSLNSWAVTPGQYLAAYWISTTTGQTAPTNMSLFGRTAGTISGLAGNANTTLPFFSPGHYATTTNAMPSAIQVSDIQITGSVMRQAWFRLMGEN